MQIEGNQMTFEEIIEAINQAKLNGFDRSVYLGSKQMNIVKRQSVLTGWPKLHGIRYEIHGLRVYLVDAVDHFGVL
jgi:hypothetical protein